MKKNYFYLFSVFLFSIVIFSLIGMEASDSDDSFSNLNISENFEEFYQQYFAKVFAYDQLQEIVKRFSFIFWYLKARNIGNILKFENNPYVDFEKKTLSESEIDQIKNFFKDTVNLIESNDIFKGYLTKSDKENFSEDPLRLYFDSVLENLSLSKEFLDQRNKKIEDLTFLVKNISYEPGYIQQHVASDVHSSPEYFGLEYERIDFSIDQLQKSQLKNNSLENLYEEIKKDMKEKEVSLFGGDLGDRDSLGFLDEETNEAIYRKNFFLYNFFKDYYHTVHATWQFYCLYYDQPNKIKRWQVFGNHETEAMYLCIDYENAYQYFSGLISSIRKIILPTEIYFLQPNGTVVLRHGFFTQKMNEKNHVGKTVNENFKYIYLKKELTPEYEVFSPFIKNYSPMNSVYWSDHHDTNNSLDLDVLVAGECDEEEINIPMSGSSAQGYRGYYNPYSWEKGVGIGKQTSIENLKLINKDEFLSTDELDHIQSSHWALFCGHSHNEHSLAFSAVKKNQAVSFHPYYVRDEKFLFHFCMCSHHNLYVQWFDKAFKKIQKTEVNLKMIDWKSTEPVHALETYWGAQWLKEKMKKSGNSLEVLTKNSVIKEFFRFELERKAKTREDDTEEKIWRNVKVIFNTQETQTEQPEQNQQKIQTEFIKKELSLAQTVQFLINENSKKVETDMQTEINNKEKETRTDKVMDLSLLENKLRFVMRGSFERIKQRFMSNQEVQTETSNLKIITQTQLQNLKIDEPTIEKAHDVDLLRIIGVGFLGTAGFSLVCQVKSQGIKNFSRSIYDSWQQKGKFRLVLRKDIFIGGGSAAIGYALYSKFPLFFNQKKEDKRNDFQMKDN